MGCSAELILLGGGHAHLEVLRRFARQPDPGLRITLIAREPQTPYSSMLPGLIRGDYRFEQAHVDLAPVASAAGARLIVAEATDIDLAGRAVSLRAGADVRFDLLSVDVGGEPPAPMGIPVKPIGRFLERLDQAEAGLPEGGRVAVVGAGAGGAELALALACRYHDLDPGRVTVALVGAEAEPVPRAPGHARAIVRRALRDAGIEFVGGVMARPHALGPLASPGALALSDGSLLAADAVLWATGIVAPAFLAASGLASDEAGCIRVGRTLRSVSHDFIFAAGDCASVEGAPRPKAGVWAVRAGGPLEANLRRRARGQKLRCWRPQRDALVILGLGNGRAVAWRNGLTVAGRWVWALKDRIDRNWTASFPG
jgi:selenide, water dikinase